MLLFGIRFPASVLAQINHILENSAGLHLGAFVKVASAASVKGPRVLAGEILTEVHLGSAVQCGSKYLGVICDGLEVRLSICHSRRCVDRIDDSHRLTVNRTERETNVRNRRSTLIKCFRGIQLLAAILRP